MKECTLLSVNLVEVITFYPFKCQVQKSRPPRPLCPEPNTRGQQCGKPEVPQASESRGHFVRL